MNSIRLAIFSTALLTGLALVPAGHAITDSVVLRSSCGSSCQGACECGDKCACKKGQTCDCGCADKK